jgi:hypothetical protein
MLACCGCPSVLAITLNSKLSNQSHAKLCAAYRDRVVSHHSPTCPFRLTSQEFRRILHAGTDVDPNRHPANGMMTTTANGCGKQQDQQQQESELSENDGNQLFGGDKRESVLVLPTVPPYMAAVLSEECIRLFGHPTPSTILRGRVRQLIDILPYEAKTTATIAAGTTASTTPSTITRRTIWKYPKLVIPTEIQRLNHSADAAVDLLRLDMVSRRESIVALAVLGWTPIEKVVVDSAPVVTLGCPLCLSVMELSLELEPHEKATDGEVNEEVGQGGNQDEGDSASRSSSDDRQQQNKRLRQLSRYCNPLDAHRHYCPYKCGFPNTAIDRPTPFWQVIINRLNQEVATARPAHSSLVSTADGGLVGRRGRAGGGEDIHPPPSMATTTLLGVDEDDDDGTIAGCILDASIERVRKILQAGIAPREVDLGI